MIDAGEVSAGSAADGRLISLELPSQFIFARDDCTPRPPLLGSDLIFARRKQAMGRIT